MEIFRLENLSYKYPQREEFALKDIDLRIDEGDFTLFVGASGSGKSTLARVLNGLIPEFYGGNISGKAYFRNMNLKGLERKEISKEVGMVFQNPERQLIMNKVEEEIVFGCENLNMDLLAMKRRLAEVLSFMNLSALQVKNTQDLSGGEKQKVAIASVLAMNPKVLILDEPTSQLDPLSAQELFDILKRLNQELGFTVILIEQHLDKCFNLADKIILLEKGRIKYNASANKFVSWARNSHRDFIPLVAQLFADKYSINLPLTINQGRSILNFHKLEQKEDLAQDFSNKKELIRVKNLNFSYTNNNPIFNGIDLSLKEKEFLCILGNNGAGKSTLLKLLCGSLKPNSGEMLVLNQNPLCIKKNALPKMIGYLSQNPNDYLFNDSVAEEVSYVLRNLNMPNEGLVNQLVEFMGLSNQKNINPRDLSTGQRQRVALAAVLASQPQILLLDEPTRGLDLNLKRSLGEKLCDLNQQGKTILLVTQDVDFAAEYAQRIVLLFNGEIVADGSKQEVLKNELFYSSSMSRLFQGFHEGVICFEQARRLINEEIL